MSEYIYKIINEKVTIYRVYGKDGNVEIPAFIDGYPVSAIYDYCFSAKCVYDSDVLYTGAIDHLTCIVCDLLEQVHLPNSLTSIGSFAFYNCRKLRSLSLYEGNIQLGSDVFMNSKLDSIVFHCLSDSMTCLKQILTQITWDCEVSFLDTKVFFPEYDGYYDEVGPAHIFALNIHGEGFRLRQCFDGNILQLNKLDASFSKLCAEESIETCVHFALCRVLQNAYYRDFLLQHNDVCIQFVNEDNIVSLLECGCLSLESLNHLIMNCENVSLKLKYMEHKKQFFDIKNAYSFEDF